MNALAFPARRRYRPLDFGFWPRFLVTTRPYLACVSGTAGLVGLAFVRDASTAFWSSVAVFFLAYGLGQAVTDVFQTDTDALSSPYRPLCRGEIRRKDVLAVATIGLAACALVLFVQSPRTLLPAALAVVGLFTYTPFKRRWWGGPLYNAWIVATLPLMGALTAPVVSVDPRLPYAMASALLSYAVFVVLGYFKDVEADRATGYVTLPVRFGRPKALAVSAVFGAGSLLASLPVVRPFFERPWSWSLPGGVAFLAGAGLLVAAHVRMLGVSRDDEAHPAIALSVRAFVLLRLGEACVVAPSFSHGAIAIVILLEFLLGARPSVTQV